jgi:nicotinamidase-related amidase
MIAHSAVGKLFDIPVIMTTSAQQGPNGPLPKEILDMYPDAPLIRRQGEVDAWDNVEFKAAVRAANKSQIIMAGIVTDVCMWSHRRLCRRMDMLKLACRHHFPGIIASL